MAVPKLNILQWNSRSIKANNNALTQYIQDHPEFSLLAISETHLHPLDNFQFLNYVSYRADRPCQKGGGAALFLHPLLPAEQINFLTPLEAVAVRVNYKGVKSTIVSIYVPPNDNKNQEIQDLLAQITHPAIICGDFNAHLQSAGSAYSNQRGRFIQRQADIENFNIINTDQPTLRQHPNNNPTAPDLSLVSDSLLDQLTWKVTEHTLGSDHHLIHITTSVPQQAHSLLPPPPRRQFDKANWESYSNHLQSAFTTFPEDNIELWYNSFVENLQSVANSSIPWTKPVQSNTSRPTKPWWNTQCGNAYKDMLDAQKDFRRDTASMDKYVLSNKSAAIFKKTSKEAKLEHWKQFCSSLSSQSKPSHIWRMIKQLKHQHGSTTSPALTASDWETDFLDRIAPQDSPPSPPLDWQALHGTAMTPEHPFYEKPLTRTELNLALATVNLKVTPGPDNISYAMLSHLPENGKEILLSWFNKLWEKSYCPTDWKKSWLKPILKAGKKPGDQNSYRPILYTSCVAKLFETMLKRRLIDFLDTNQLLPISQHGFRKGRNVQMCLADLTSSAQLSLTKKQMHFALMIDIKGAFDNVPHKGLLEELHFIGLPQ